MSRQTITHEICTSTCAHVYFVYCCDELHYKYQRVRRFECGFSCHSNIIASISHTPRSDVSLLKTVRIWNDDLFILDVFNCTIFTRRHPCKAPWINDSSRRRLAATTISYRKKNERKKISDLFCYARAEICENKLRRDMFILARN